MATKKSGMQTTSKGWARHLKAWGKRAFWKAERRCARKASAS